MKKHKLSSFLRWTTRNSLRAMLLATTLSLLAACTADDRIAGDSLLPQGKYPLTFTATQADATATASPQTRVSENTDGMSSKWDGDEQISVRIGNATETGTYTLHADGTIKTADKPLYWQNTASQTVTAWYSNISGQSTTTNNTVSLADQSSGLAYVMKATAAGVAYNTPVSLRFQHQLAKVRVMLTGEKADDVKTVQVYSYTSCTHMRGESVSGSAADWITMKSVTYDGTKCWEANVVPGYAIKVKVNDTECQLTTSVTPQKATLHAITIDVKQREPTVLQPGTDGNYTVNAGDYVVIDGGGKLSNASINIKGTAKVVLRNINLKKEIDDNASIHITNGEATIILEGENKIEARNHWDSRPAIWLDGSNAHVVIQGSSLTATAYYGNAVIGARRSPATSCGNITIKDAEITVSANQNTGTGAGAAIGTATGYDGGNNCGIITIKNSTITASVGSSSGFGDAAVIGTGGTDSGSLYCAGINIYLQEGQSKAQFLQRITGKYYTQVGAGEALNNISNKCEYVKWFSNDGTPIE